jgi:hypothetical protein
MPTSRFSRAAFVCAFGFATLSIAACAGGATTGAGGASPLGNGTGSSGGSGGGGATAAPVSTATPTPSGGGASASPTPGASSAPTGSSSSAPTTGATATPSSLDSINVIPAVIDGDLGGIAQIGVIDPGYTGGYNVTVSGGGILGNALDTVGNLLNGTLQGSPNGQTLLTLNLADAVQLGLLGPNGNVVTICEQQNPSTCKQVNISNNGVVPMIGSTLDSIVINPSSIQTIGLIEPALAYANFTLVSTPSGISVTNLGNGQFSVSAAANVSPLSGNIVITDGMGHTITIPIAVP